MPEAYTTIDNVIIANFVCSARVWWNAFLHDKPITYADARKRIDR